MYIGIYRWILSGSLALTQLQAFWFCLCDYILFVKFSWGGSLICCFYVCVCVCVCMWYAICHVAEVLCVVFFNCMRWVDIVHDDTVSIYTHLSCTFIPLYVFSLRILSIYVHSTYFVRLQVPLVCHVYIGNFQAFFLLILWLHGFFFFVIYFEINERNGL